MSRSPVTRSRRRTTSPSRPGERRSDAVDLYDILWLNNFWFLILGVLLSGYGILDGFDLGVGILHLNVRKDEERRILMNSIGPIWDGNEVWLVVLGGAVFAA